MKILELLVLLLLAAESWISSQEWKKLVQDPLDAQVTDTITWISLVAGLKACGGVGALKRGQVMHAKISKRELIEKDVIANAAINMYSKWGRISGKDSTKLITRDMNSCDVVSPADFQEGGKQCFWERTEATLRELQEASQEYDSESIVMFCLKACSSVSDVDKGQEIHMELVEEGFDSGYLVGSALASGYAKCGFTVEAQGVFDELVTLKVISGTTLLTSHPLYGHACSMTGAIDHWLAESSYTRFCQDNPVSLRHWKGRKPWEPKVLRKEPVRGQESQDQIGSGGLGPASGLWQAWWTGPCEQITGWTESYTCLCQDNPVSLRHWKGREPWEPEVLREGCIKFQDQEQSDITGQEGDSLKEVWIKEEQLKIFVGFESCEIQDKSTNGTANEKCHESALGVVAKMVQQDKEDIQVGKAKEEGLDVLREVLCAERKMLTALEIELEKERNAVAIATSKTMAMISRLQEEKPAMQLVVAQLQRMAPCGFQFVIVHLDGRKLLIKPAPREIVKPCQFKATDEKGMPIALEAILPLKPSSEMTNMKLGECDKTILQNVNLEKEMKRKQQHQQSQKIHENQQEARRSRRTRKSRGGVLRKNGIGPQDQQQNDISGQDEDNSKNVWTRPADKHLGGEPDMNARRYVMSFQFWLGRSFNLGNLLSLNVTSYNTLMEAFCTTMKWFTTVNDKGLEPNLVSFKILIKGFIDKEKYEKSYLVQPRFGPELKQMPYCNEAKKTQEGLGSGQEGPRSGREKTKVRKGQDQARKGQGRGGSRSGQEGPRSGWEKTKARKEQDQARKGQGQGSSRTYQECHVHNQV
ncbi:hypothetical protein L7F22_015685 [Adiantum nelumboides]|nr:hypothetical protein [Adiantum nelumboides]